MIKKMKKYFGVIVPMITPVTKTGKIDEASEDKLINIVLNTGGFPFILGTTGEIASNSYTNRETLAKLAVKLINGRTTLYAGITDNCINNTLNFAKKFFDWGINVFVVHLPYFFPLTSDLMLKYYETIADNSPAPIVVYNIKSITHMSIPIDVIEKLSRHPNIVGLKDSDRDIKRVEKLAELFKDRDDFSLFIGWTNKSSEALLLGFDGIVPNTANIVPGLFQSLYKAAVSGNKEQAINYQAKADTLANLVLNNKTMTWTIPAIKTIMHSIDICEPNVLPPLKTLAQDESSELIKEYRKLDL